MARFGLLPVRVPSSVEIALEGEKLVVKGPKGEVSRVIPRGITIAVKEGEASVSQGSKRKSFDALRGTTRAHLTNMIKGVSEGWSRSLELVGAGFRAEVKGQELILSVGYSHPVVVTAPSGVSFKVEKATVTVQGVDRDVVGEMAAKIRKVRPPDPYKGKGIRYADEVVKTKPGKQAAKGEAQG